MKSLRASLYKLKTNEFGNSLDISKSPLGQQVGRPKMPDESFRRNHQKVSVGAESVRERPSRVRNERCLVGSGDAILGNLVRDWTERGFELCHATCELKYQCSRKGAGHSQQNDMIPVGTTHNTVSLGFIHEHTTVCAGADIQTIDRDPVTLEKLCLHTIEIAFLEGSLIKPRFYTLGHPDAIERDKWLHAMQAIVARKKELQLGWLQFSQAYSENDSRKAEQWIRRRSGDIGVDLNLVARRKARLQNGKVLHDLPRVFEKFSEVHHDAPKKEEWPQQPLDCVVLHEHRDAASTETGMKTRLMDTSRLVESLAELGLEISPKIAKRVQDDLLKNPPIHEFPCKIDLARFRAIFRSCWQELLLAPSEEMKASLVRIMQDSKNPFLSLLSSAEQKYLIEGQDADGRYFCNCKSYIRDTVLVQQGDDGDSMFIIIEGSLSVVVAFGDATKDAEVVQKEVAVLPAGSVMGEMSLVLGKPRSATCVVKSESASVAEITKAAMVRLLEARPSLARELEDMVHRRDTANYLNAGNNVAAMAAYRQRSKRAEGFFSDSASTGAAGSAAWAGLGLRVGTGPATTAPIGPAALAGVGGDFPTRSQSIRGSSAGLVQVWAGSKRGGGANLESANATATVSSVLPLGPDSDAEGPARPSACRIQSRTTKALPRRGTTANFRVSLGLHRSKSEVPRRDSDGPVPHRGLPGPFGSVHWQGGRSGGAGEMDSEVAGSGPAIRVKTGRWIKCRGIYVFLVD